MTLIMAVFCGFMFGMILATLMERTTRASILEHCARQKGREKINGRFYYIVSEDDYLELEQAARKP